MMRKKILKEKGSKMIPRSDKKKQKDEKNKCLLLKGKSFKRSNSENKLFKKI